MASKIVSFFFFGVILISRGKNRLHKVHTSKCWWLDIIFSLESHWDLVSHAFMHILDTFARVNQLKDWSLITGCIRFQWKHCVSLFVLLVLECKNNVSDLYSKTAKVNRCCLGVLVQTYRNGIILDHGTFSLINFLKKTHFVAVPKKPCILSSPLISD